MLSLATATVDAGDADSLAQAMIAVSGDGVTCTTYADCLDKLNAGENINYDGVSGQIQLDDERRPDASPASPRRCSKVASFQYREHRCETSPTSAPAGGLRCRSVLHQLQLARSTWASTPARSTA